MPHFFVKPEAIRDGKVILENEDAKHIGFSLRMAVGEEITVSDGEGQRFLCRLEKIDGESVTAAVLAREESRAEMPVRVHLYQGYPKSDKLEFIIQKAVELGVCAVTPFESSRCIKRPKAEKTEHLAERQNKIAKEAAKQCGRDILPHVYPPLSFSAMLEKAKTADLVLFCYEGGGTKSIRELLLQNTSAKEIALIVGSEGGFSEEEAEKARQSGALLCGLGGRILRCETAPLYALSSISCLLEL